MPDFIDELARLYAEYLDERESDENVDLAAYPDPADDHTRRIKAELPRFDGDSLREVIDTAIEWWNTHCKSLPQGRARFERLHYLLRCVDEILRNHTPQRFDTSMGSLTIGPPWWNLYRRVRADAAGDWAHAYQFTPQRAPLMNIRLLRGENPRCVKSGRFQSRMQLLLASNNRPAELRIGLCVLGDRGQVEFAPTTLVDESQKMYGFKSTRVADLPDCAGSVEQELRENIDWARRNGVHILCFPEFSVDSAGLAVIREEILTDPGSLCLVIPGSFHAEVEGKIGRANRAPVWLVEQDIVDGNTVTQLHDSSWYDKGDPFTLEADDARGALSHVPEGAQSFREHIDLGTDLTVIDTAVGRVGIAICKDLLGTDIAERYGTAIDHLIVISLSPKGGGTFWGVGDLASRRERIAVYYVNSCQWVERNNSSLDLAYACFPERRYLENVAYLRQIPPNAPNGQDPSGKWRPATLKTLPSDRNVWISIPVPSTVLNG